jgi:hypothetical protein
LSVIVVFIAMVFYLRLVRGIIDLREVEVKRLILLIALVVLLAGLPVLVVSDTSPTDSNIPDNELTTSQTEASNSSASATITITMTGILNE